MSSISAGQLRVHLLQVAVERLEALADLVAAALEGVGEGVQRVVQLSRLHRAQQRVEVVEHPLDLDRHLGLVDLVACREGLGGRVLGDVELDVLLTEERLGHDRGRHVLRDRLDQLGLDAQLQGGAVALGLRLHDLADDHAADLDVRLRGQLQADRAGAQVHAVEGDELLREHGVHQPDAADQHADEHDTEEPVVGEELVHHGQPANLTVVEEPQMAMDRNRSITLIATIEVRTARPTATPTPAGPPLAV